MSDVKAKAAEMFAAGESVNAVAKALFEGSYYRAKKAHDAWQQPGGAAAENPAPGRKKKAAAEEPETPEIWDVQLEVPDAALDGFIATFTREEKASAVASALQSRMNALGAG